MSLPPELRVLCNQLSTTPVTELPRLIPTLLRHIMRCQAPLSSQAGNAVTTDASASSVLVHKLKTHLSTLINGKSPEGRFTAVVLIKAVVEVGGWEVLRGCESWVRGLLSVLGKPDASATKELSIVALTKIYCMTHQYQTLVREITTPTLPTFVTSCLNLISFKSSTKTLNVSQSLPETIFQSFIMLIPRHTTIFRPFVSQIRAITKQYVAPTCSDGVYTSPSLKESARRLVAVLHQTVAKGAGGEEWGKALRDIIKDVHITADIVFRVVIEDWESTTGHVANAIDVNREAFGGARDSEDLPQWTGIDAGVDRLTGLLELLSVYIQVETSTPVTIPLGSITDMVTRMLSISIPQVSELSVSKGGARLHPAIDRDERDALWSGMPSIYVAALGLVGILAERLQEGFMSLAHGILEQLIWVFPFGKYDRAFRTMTYTVLSDILRCIGQGLGKTTTGKMGAVVKSCCKDTPHHPADIDPSQHAAEGNGSNRNVDSFLPNASGVSSELPFVDRELADAVYELLPLFISHLPQHYVDISIRSLVERTAVLATNKNAMLASVLNPFVGKNGKTMPSLLPHLTRQFPHDDATETLLRPRMPVIPAAQTQLRNEAADINSDDEDMGMDLGSASMHKHTFTSNGLSDANSLSHAVTQHGLGPKDTPLHDADSELSVKVSASFLGTSFTAPPVQSQTNRAPVQVAETTATVQDQHSAQSTSFTAPLQSQLHESRTTDMRDNDVKMTNEVGEDSDDESVHLTMELDTESDDE